MNWEEPRDEGSWVEQGVQQGRWDDQQVAGSQMVGWQVKPQYRDISPQHNQGGLYREDKDQQYYDQINNEDQQHYDQFNNEDQQYYDQFKVEDQQYYDQFRAQIDQIQRRGGSRRDPSSYPRLPRRGIERDVQQSLFGSERQFGELTDLFFQPAESDSIFGFGRETVQLGQPVAWEEARKRSGNIRQPIQIVKKWCKSYGNDNITKLSRQAAIDRGGKTTTIRRLLSVYQRSRAQGIRIRLQSRSLQLQSSRALSNYVLSLISFGVRACPYIM